MKTLRILLIFQLCFLVSASAQTVTVIKRYDPLPDTKAYYPVFNRTGDKLLYSSDGYNVLWMYDFTKKTVTEISDQPGAGYEPSFDNENSSIFYRKTSYIQNRKFDAIESFTIANNKKTVMLSPKRDVKQAKNYHNGFLVTAERKLIKSTFGKTTSRMPVYVNNQDLKIYLYRNNKFTVLNPLNQPDSKYLWVSVSPDEKMILFTAAGKGAFICDLEGKIVSTLGYLNAPVWYNNNFVVGMQDKDDGHVVTNSKVIMISVNGKSKTVISDSNEIAMYPTATGEASKIAYNTLDGKIRIADISIK